MLAFTAQWDNGVLLTLDGRNMDDDLEWALSADSNPQHFAGETDEQTTVAIAELASRSPKALVPGDEYYIKQTKSPEHARNEVLANTLYQMAGVAVPEMLTGSDGQSVGSKILKGGQYPLTDFIWTDPDVMAQIRKNLVIDAWLANWDVVGLENDNIVVAKSGDKTAWRIDTGGALLFRAQGAPKGTAFGDEVGEIDSLRNESINPTAAKVFGGVNQAELMDGAERLQAITPHAIHAAVENAGFDESLSNKLIARRKDILDKLGIVDHPAAEFHGTKSEGGVLPETPDLEWEPTPPNPLWNKPWTEAEWVASEKEWEAHLEEQVLEDYANPMDDVPLEQPNPTALANAAEDPPVATVPEPPPAPVVAVDGVNQDLSIVNVMDGKSLIAVHQEWVDAGAPEPPPLVALLKGRSFLIDRPQWQMTGVDPKDDSLYYVAPVEEPSGLWTVEDVNEFSSQLGLGPSNTTIHLRSMSGETRTLTGNYALEKMEFHELSQPLVPTGPATMRKDGKIVVKGEVVGYWTKDYWYGYRAHLYPANSVKGERITLTHYKKSAIRMALGRFATATAKHPVAPAPKSKGKKPAAVSLEKEVKAAAAAPLAKTLDGVAVEYGGTKSVTHKAWVEDPKDGFKGRNHRVVGQEEGRRDRRPPRRSQEEEVQEAPPVEVSRHRGRG